jgi:hypothetical protein
VAAEWDGGTSVAADDVLAWLLSWTWQAERLAAAVHA